MAETDLTKMTPAELVEALIKDNSLTSEFDRLDLWGKFDSWKWSNLLSAQSQFADKCTEYNGWEKFDYWEWRNLLFSQTQLWIYCPKESINKIKENPTKANECKCLNKISSAEWCEILSIHPSLAGKCQKWHEFDSRDWRNLLKAQPQFADKYPDYLNKISHAEWCEILSIHPSLADKCKKWRWFDSDDWSKLLKAQPQFADKCTDKKYDQFSQKNWEELEAKHPGVFEDKHMLSTLRKLARD